MGTYIGLGVLSLTSAILIAKKKLLGLKLGLASTLAILLLSITYVSVTIFIEYLSIYSTITVAILGPGMLSSILAILSLIFIGLSWNYIERK